MSGGDHCWFKRSTGEKRPVTGDIYIIIIIISCTRKTLEIFTTKDSYAWNVTESTPG